MLGKAQARKGTGSLVKKPMAKKKPAVDYHKEVQPLLSQYCYDCHGEKKPKADLDLSRYRDVASILQDRKHWEKVLHNLRSGEMPPKKKPQPSDPQRQLIATWIESELFPCDCDNPDPGRVTVRRLNRAEYNNTIRDLVGVNFQPADDFPQDDVGYGFDNIGDVLSMPPILLEKYLSAAEKILGQAILIHRSTNGPTHRLPPVGMLASASASGNGHGQFGFSINREGDISTNFFFPKQARYQFKIRAFGQQAGPELPKMELKVNGQPVKTFEVKAVESSPRVYEVGLDVPAGTGKVSLAYLNNFVNPQEKNPSRRDRNLIVEMLEIVGPPGLEPLPETHTRIFKRAPQGENYGEVAREIFSDFARRAYRRPVEGAEVERLMAIFNMARADGSGFEQSVKTALTAVLVSPHFLFRGELQPEPDNPRQTHPIGDFALASRLSYFLWSSMPDEELFREAGKKNLRKNLDFQLRRMLKSPKATALVENFASQWLQTRNLSTFAPDKKVFPGFDESLRQAMSRETDMFVEYILTADRSVLEFLSADYSFLNERLARHYGIEGVTGDEFRKVSLRGTPRGGLLTQGSILAITSNPTRTSPVKRGKWVLDNILGTPPPPPPPEVPELSEEKGKELTGTLRQRMEQHREDPSCASCHARMDPIGFGFENYDAIGAWRTNDGKFPIDAAGELVSGEKFQGSTDLRTTLLKSKRDEFLKCFTEKLLTYALGRGLEYYDKCAVEEVMKAAAKEDYRFSAVVSAIIKSVPFQMRRGEGDRTVQTAGK